MFQFFDKNCSPQPALLIRKNNIYALFVNRLINFLCLIISILINSDKWMIYSINRLINFVQGKSNGERKN